MASSLKNSNGKGPSPKRRRWGLWCPGPSWGPSLASILPITHPGGITSYPVPWTLPGPDLLLHCLPKAGYPLGSPQRFPLPGKEEEACDDSGSPTSLAPHPPLFTPQWVFFLQFETTLQQERRKQEPPSSCQLPSAVESFLTYAWGREESSHYCGSVAKSCLTLCHPMDCSTPGSSVLHNLPEFAQTHVHWVGDSIHPSHLLLSPSPPAFNLSQHQGLLQWVSSSHQVA